MGTHPISLAKKQPARALATVALGPLQPLSAGTAQRAVTGVPFGSEGGQWLRLRLLSTTPIACLVARSASRRWPDLLAFPQPDGSAWQLWMHLVPAMTELWLQGSVDALSSPPPLEVQLFDDLPDGAPAGTVMFTSEALYQLGVRELRDIVIEPDRAWPLRATSEDPQLRFASLGRHARWQLSFEICRPDGVAAGPPVVYWAGPRQSFAPQRVIEPWADPGEGQSRVELPGGVRWRLDPQDVPGVFRLDRLALQPVQNKLAHALRDSALRHLRALRPWRGCEDLLPTQQLNEVAGSTHAWLATGDDPQWQVRDPLPAGWYMLELKLAFPAARARAMVYPDEGQGFAEASACPLLLRSGQLVKRLVWLRQAARLRLDPLSAAGPFELHHFRMLRVTAGFARSRMRRKLEAAGQRPSSLRCLDADRLWQSYAALFRPDHDGMLNYAEWIQAVEAQALPSPEAQREQIDAWAWRPLISVLVPVFDPPLTFLAECLSSVQSQTYPNWQLCIADDASSDPRVLDLLSRAAAQDARIRLVRRPRNGHIVEASNSALALAEGEFVALLDHDDRLAPHALYTIVEALQTRRKAQILYSDEDKLDADGERCEPFFKPAWSPDLLRAQNYVSHLGCYRRDLVLAVGGFRTGYEGSQDHDLLLRCVERIFDAEQIVHLPKVLYHWRKSAGSTAAAAHQKPYAVDAARRALQEHADRTHSKVRVEVVAAGVYRHRWPIPSPAPLVTLIIPTRDGLDLLKPCLDSVRTLTRYPHYDVLIVDNGSRDPALRAWLESLQAQDPDRIHVLRDDAPFNFAALNNQAVQVARGDLVCLLNNDVEVREPDWLGEMVSLASRNDVGCVGAKLLYPDGSLQHAGVVLGIGGVAGHSHKYFPGDSEGYFSRLRTVHEVSAVTAAAMMVRKSIWQQVGGMDQDGLQVAFNDVDFCLKVREQGYRNLFTPWAVLVHHESRTRGTDLDPERRVRFGREVEVMKKRWDRRLLCDPFYNPNLTLVREDYSLGMSCPNGEPR